MPDEPKKPTKYMQLREAQHVLGVISRKTLIRRLRKGEIPGGELLYTLEKKGGARAGRKAGERWVIVRAVFERWVALRDEVRKAG